MFSNKTFKLSTDWQRLITESVVIVLSILLAFAIDAWWDQKQAHADEIKKLKLVKAEILVNTESINNKLQILRLARDGASRFLSWMGPNPENIDIKEIVTTWEQLIGIGTFSMTRSASANFLATSDLENIQNTTAYSKVADWYSKGNSLQGQYNILRENHAAYMNTLEESIPTLHLLFASQVMQKHPRSKFQFDPQEIFSNQEAESRLAHYLIRLEFVISTAEELYSMQEEILLDMNVD